MCRRPSPPIVRRPAARRVPRPGARPRSNPTEAASPYNPPDVGLVASAPRLTRPAAILGISAHGLIMRVDAKRSEEHTSELQSQSNLVCRLLLEKKKKKPTPIHHTLRHTTPHSGTSLTLMS